MRTGSRSAGRTRRGAARSQRRSIAGDPFLGIIKMGVAGCRRAVGGREIGVSEHLAGTVKVVGPNANVAKTRVILRAPRGVEGVGPRFTYLREGQFSAAHRRPAVQF